MNISPHIFLFKKSIMYQICALKDEKILYEGDVDQCWKFVQSNKDLKYFIVREAAIKESRITR
jgi:hypothetical protein